MAEMEMGADAVLTKCGRNARDWMRGADYVLAALVMGLMGAFFWAIRGTGGYGGSTGGILAGLGWAALWYLFSIYGGAAKMRPYATGRMVAAITFGIAVGGMTGYGVYIGWLQGKFFLDHPHGMRTVAPWTGYAMLFLCGLHWGGLTGAFMAWCAPRRPPGWIGWLLRIAAGIAGAIAAAVIVRAVPQFFLPFYSEGLYQVEENETCIRALGSIRNIAPHVGMFFGFLAFEAFRRDWRAVGMMLVMALGFAIPFTVGGYWQTLHGSSLPPLDWWKHWEMTIGLGGGLAFGLAFCLFNRPVPEAPPRPAGRMERIWGTGFTLCFGCGIVLGGAYEGFHRLHGLECPPAIRTALRITYFLIAGTIFLRWILQTRKLSEADLSDPAAVAIPAWALVFTLAIILGCGYLTSVPPEMRLANAELLVLYSIYLLTSLGLVGLLRKRRNRLRA